MAKQSIRVNFVTGAVRRYLPQVEALAAIPARTAAAVEEGSPSWFAGHDAIGDWSPARVVAHMIAYATATYEHIYRMAWMTEPNLNLHDESAAADAEEWQRHNAEHLLYRLAEEIAR